MKTLTVLWMVAFTSTLLALGVAAPAPAWGQASGILSDSQEPGSFLVFPKFQTGTVNTNEEGLLPRSEFEISVVCPNGVTCSQDPTNPTRVLLKAAWVCGRFGGDLDNAFPDQCNETNFLIPTTVNATVYFGAQGATAVNLGPKAISVPAPPNCNRGFLVVWVVDTFGNAIKYDALIGDAVLRTQTGGSAAGLSTAGQYNAIPIQGSASLNQGDQIPLAGTTGPDPAFAFDGTGYQAITGKVKGSVRYPGPTFQLPNVPMPVQTGSIETTLVLLTLDVHIGTINPPTHVDIFFGNEAEQLRSASANFVCRGEARLDRTPLNVTNTFGRKGSLESAAAERIIPPGVGSSPATLLGLIQTLERNANGDVVREYYSLLSNDSVPVPTTFSAP